MGMQTRSFFYRTRHRNDLSQAFLQVPKHEPFCCHSRRLRKHLRWKWPHWSPSRNPCCFKKCSQDAAWCMPCASASGECRGLVTVGWYQDPVHQHGGNKDGHDNVLAAWLKRSCWRLWGNCWCLACRWQSCFVASNLRQGGVETTWSQIWQLMVCWRMRQQLCLWSMMGIGVMRKRKASCKIDGKAWLCSPWHLRDRMW